MRPSHISRPESTQTCEPYGASQREPWQYMRRARSLDMDVSRSSGILPTGGVKGLDQNAPKMHILSPAT